LRWKFSDVLRGRLPEDVLDSYEVERQPHVRTVTKAAVAFGRIITERNRLVTTLHNPVLRAVMRTPYLGSWIRDARWFPEPRYPDGFMASLPAGVRRRRGADGRGIPQPWVINAKGERLRLDDAVPAGWVVLRTAGAAVDVSTWEDFGVPVIDILPTGSGTTDTAVVDVEGGLAAWLRKQKAAAVVIRPDKIVYTSAATTGRLAEPPFLTRESV
jgi:3-(3-hydroxy-phenyl)propionate hydroxylase